jgi:hypothetical protein
MSEKLNPVFVRLMTQYAELHEAGQAETPEARDLFCEAMQYAPDSIKEMAHKKAVEMGLMPEKPDGYRDDGEPLYDMGKQCERLGINPDDVPEHLTRRAYRGNFNRAH